MSKASVRAGITTWLLNNVTGIATVLPSRPNVLPASSFYTGVGQTVGCVAFLYLTNDSEKRIAYGGATSGWKQVTYDVQIELLIRQSTTGVINTNSAQAATDNSDTFLDNLKARIRADRTAGGTLWQWASEIPGEDDLSVQCGLPYERGDIVELWAVLSTRASEMINA